MASDATLTKRTEAAVRNLESAADREARARSRGAIPVRFLTGILGAFGFALIAPVFWLTVWLRERKEDKQKLAAMASEHPVIEPDKLATAIEAAPRIDSLSAPICIMPLADFTRLGVLIPEDSGKRFVLLAPVIYEIEDADPVGRSTEELFKGLLIPGQAHLRQVPAGFVTDFASIPWFLQILGQPAGRYGRAAVFHDWAYAYHHDGSHRGRMHCDQAMLRLMRRDGVSTARRSLIYVGLRIGGGWAFFRAPDRREAARPHAEALVFPHLGVQSFLLAYFVRQMEDSGFLEAMPARAERTAASTGSWCNDIVDSILKKQVDIFDRVVF